MQTFYDKSDSPPDILAYLTDKYQETGTTLDKTEASAFLDFCRKYLSDHRPNETTPVTNNLGIRLTNGDRVLLCPIVGDTAPEVPGTMQGRASVDVIASRG